MPEYRQGIKLRSSPLAGAFEEFVGNLRSPCLICSPYISAAPVTRLLASIKREKLQGTLRLRIVTDLSLKNLLDGSTDASALVQVLNQVSRATVTHLPRIHAKVYVSGDRLALFGSANFTDGGAYHNFEYMASVYERSLVQQIREDVERYADLGGRLEIPRLLGLQRRVSELRALIRDEEASIRVKLQEATHSLEREAEDELLRARVEGRSITKVFADTILYLLANGPMRTVELHERIRATHPDLCDDSIDRIIDGERFGKLWKHQVRNAQQSLKRANLISYDQASRFWALGMSSQSLPAQQV